MSKKEIKFNLVGIHILSKSMTEQPMNPALVQFQFEITDDIKIQPERKLVIGNVSLRIRSVDEPIMELAALSIACVFQVDDFDTTILQDEEKLFIIPPQLEAIIRPVTISTARGIMYSELRGTYLNNAILPVIYIIPSDIPVKKKSKKPT